MSIYDYENIREEYGNHFSYYGKRYIFNGVIAKGTRVTSIYGRRQDRTEIEIPADHFLRVVDRAI